MGLSRLSAKCRACPFVEKCKSKRMEALGYLEPATITATAEVANPLFVPHDYRDVKVAENMTITIDVEELKRQMEKDFYRQMGLGLMNGA